MESSIAEFLSRHFACEQVPTFLASVIFEAVGVLYLSAAVLRIGLAALVCFFCDKEVFSPIAAAPAISCSSCLWVRRSLGSWGPKAPAKIVEVTLMRPIHGNL